MLTSHRAFVNLDIWTSYILVIGINIDSILSGLCRGIQQTSRYVEAIDRKKDVYAPDWSSSFSES